MRPRFTLRVDFDNGHRLGPGKARLLGGIRRTGSISAAGREMAMSYRRAWMLIDELNHMFAAPLVETQTGGRQGGGARLTTAGEEVLALYESAEAAMTAGAATELDGLGALARPRTEPPAP